MENYKIRTAIEKLWKQISRSFNALYIYSGLLKMNALLNLKKQKQNMFELQLHNPLFVQ